MAVASNKIAMHSERNFIRQTHDQTRCDAVPAQKIANILDWSTTTEFVVPETPVPKVPGDTTR